MFKKVSPQIVCFNWTFSKAKLLTVVKGFNVKENLVVESQPVDSTTTLPQNH